MATIMFQTKRLVELAKKAVANKDAATAEWEKIRADYLEKNRTDWLSDSRQTAIKGMRDYLTEQLRKGLPPTSEDVKKRTGFYPSDLMYSEPSDWTLDRELKSKEPKYLRIGTTDFRALIETLSSSSATEVSPNQLAILGFKSEALQRLFRESLSDK